MAILHKIIKKFKEKAAFQKDLWKAKRISKNLIVSFDESLFKNKRVAIIGGADSAFKIKNGEYIDGFDVVVRVNKGVEIIEKHSEYIGKRTDVLFHCLYEESDYGGSPVTLDLWKKNKVKLLIFSLNKGINRYALNNASNFFKKYKSEVPFGEVSVKLCKKNLIVPPPYSPTTGFIAINTVWNCSPSELYITGFTFLKTPHHQDYRKGTVEHFTNMMNMHNSHNLDFEFNWVNKLYVKNPEVIIPDNTLLELFQNLNHE
jgi:hypothetical protein